MRVGLVVERAAAESGAQHRAEVEELARRLALEHAHEHVRARLAAEPALARGQVLGVDLLLVGHEREHELRPARRAELTPALDAEAPALELGSRERLEPAALPARQ